MTTKNGSRPGDAAPALGTAQAGSWTSAPWIGFDTETTGISVTNDRIVTAAAVTWAGGPSGGPQSEQTWLADPGVSIPERATAVHGISTEHAREHGEPIAAVLEEVNEALAEKLQGGGAIVIFNAGYDLPILQAESQRHGVTPLNKRVETVAPVLDPLVLDRALVVKRRGKRTLADLCAAYRVPVSGTAHTADADAIMTLRLLAAMVQAHPQLGQMNGTEITNYQRAAHAVWAKDFEQFLRSRGKNTHISRTWF